MEINIIGQTSNMTTIMPEGRLDILTAPDFRETLDILLLSGTSNFVIDLSQTKFLDSAGLAVLVNLLKRCRLAGGDVKLVRPSHDGVLRILELTRFDRIFAFIDGPVQ